MSDDSRKQKVALECQRLARALAPFQNWGSITLPRSWFVRIIRAVFCRQNPKELTTQQVTMIVNALLDAGNMLDQRIPCNQTGDL